MSSPNVEYTNPAWGVTRFFGHRFSQTKRGAVTNINGQRTEVRYDFEYDNLPPFMDEDSNANVLYAPGSVVTKALVEVDDAFEGGTSLTLQVEADDGTVTDLGSAVLLADLGEAKTLVTVDLAGGVVLPTGKNHYVFKVEAAGTFTAGRARVTLAVDKTMNADSYIDYNQV